MPVPGERSFFRSANVISALTLCSRVLGLVRDCVCSYFFGAGAIWSAFSIAFQVPNLARRLFGEGALSAAFVPVFSETIERDGVESAGRLAGKVLLLLACVLVGLVLITEAVLVTVNWWVGGLTLSLTVVLMPYMLLICSVAFLAALLNVLHRFAVPAMAPIVLNVVLIVAAWYGGAVSGLSKQGQIYLLAGAVLGAGVLQLLLQFGALRSAGFRIGWSRDWRDEKVIRIMRLMGPMILGLSAVQINTLADVLIAKGFVPLEGAPAVLYYAQRLYQFPLGVFGVALATAIFPLLSRLAARGDTADLAVQVGRGLRMAFFIGLPSTVGLVLIANPLVRAIFERGAFTASDTERVAGTLVCYALGVWAYTLQHVLIRAFYSVQDSRTPMRIATWIVGLNLVLSLLLVQVLEERGVALATAITGMLQVLLLGRLLAGKLSEFAWQPILPAFLRTAIACVIVVVVVLVVQRLVPTGASLSSTVGQLAVMVVAGAASFAVAALALRMEELKWFIRR